MPRDSERNQFRRYVGDYGQDKISDAEIDAYLNDTTYDLTSDFVDSENVSAPVETFDELVTQYHQEVIVAAAVNYLWNKLAKLASHHTQSVGDSSSYASEKWDRIYQMIQLLQTQYDNIQTLGTDITVGNLSRFSKQHLERRGGRREEDAIKDAGF